MLNKTLDFISLLRNSDIRISISETIDCFNCLKLIPIFDKNQFKHTLKSSLIKNNDDFNLFNRLFDLYFVEIEENKEIKINENEFEDIFKEMQNEMKNDNFLNLNEQNKLKSNIFNNENLNFNKTNDLLKQGSEEDILQEAKRLINNKELSKNDINDLDETVENILNSNDYIYIKSSLKRESNNKDKKIIDEKFDLLREKIKQELEKKLVNEFGTDILKDIINNDNVYNKDLKDLKLEDIDRINDLLKKLIKKLNTKISRKEKKNNKGRINIKSTIKKSIKNGNISSELQFKKKSKNKSKLVVLCDISGSVMAYVPFMLQLVLGLENIFKEINSYVFIDTIKNISEELKISNDIKKTINDILKNNNLGYGTDYGNVFNLFSKELVFDKKTIVIILGDAENTGKTIGDDYLKTINNKVKNIIWLNPNCKSEWYNTYSNLKEYEIYCKNIYECSTLLHLETFIRDLIKF